MKKILTLLMFMSLAFSLSSCWFLDLIAILSGQENSAAAFVVAVDNAAHGNDPVVIGPAGGNEPQTPLPPGQIVGEPISSEPGGGNQQEEETGSSPRDIFTSPTFTLGPSLSWLGGDKEDPEKFPAKPGFQFGVIWQVPVGNKINVEPGLLYANRGVGYEYEYTEPGQGGSYSYGQKKRLHYLELPVFVSGRIADGLELYGGPQVGFLLGAKVVNESEGETTSTEKGTSGFNKVDVGLAAGVRYHLPNTFFSVSAGYYHGFTNLDSSSDSYGGGYDQPKYFTNAARVGVCYAVRGPGKHPRSSSRGRKGQ